jgi:pimeloyl-ACP methyl ester carboxylesterase
MKKLSFYDKLNAASLLLFSPEWRKVKRARQKAEFFETPDVTIPTETRKIAGRMIRLAEAGPSDAPLVVLLSPFPESILSYTGCWEALTEKCRVIAIDLPGFGVSEGDRNDMSPSAQGAHLTAIFDELDLQNIHLVAPDVGMAAALDYVLNHNHRLASLAIGHGIGAPGPFKIAFLTNMLANLVSCVSQRGCSAQGLLLLSRQKLGPFAIS